MKLFPNFKPRTFLLWLIPSLLMLGLYIWAVLYFNKIPPTQLTSYSGVSFEKAEVTKVIEDDTQLSSAGLHAGTQQVEIKITSGPDKGKTFTVNHYLSNTSNVYCKQGLKVIASVSVSGSTTVVTINNYDREAFLYLFVFAFCLVLWVIGGRKGLKSVVGLIFTFVSIIYLFIPMLYRGVSPYTASILIAVITTLVTLFLIGGFRAKTLAAILGTTIGVAIAGLISGLVGVIAHANGYSSEEIDSLISIKLVSHLQIGGLLFAAIIIASLGAVMDISISIASTVEELYRNNPNQSRKDLFLSGMNVGRDMMGTMANTIILAFTGGALNMLIIYYASNYPYNLLINTNQIAIEIIQGVAGSFGVILTVPIVSFLAAGFVRHKVFAKLEGRE